LEHLQRTVQLNPELAESEYAKKNIATIQAAMKTK
jgi:hypothetical protein